MSSGSNLINGVYQLETELGRGGMGAVYLAQHVLLRRQVALKVPLPTHRQDETIRARFEREARMMSRLHHENIVSVYDLRWDEHDCFIAMEYVDGQTLFDHLRQCPLHTPLRDVMGLMHQVARALDYAHSENVVHRDLKPTNVLVEIGSNRVKILDFGLARPTEKSQNEFRTAVGIVVGTPGYMAPEALTGKEPSAASDIYSFGVLLYQTLCGELPWVGREQQLIMSQLLKAPIALHEKNALLPEALTPLFADCLSIEPSKRPPSAVSFFLVVLQTLGREVLALPYGKLRRLSQERVTAESGHFAPTQQFGGLSVEAAVDSLLHQDGPTKA